MQLKNKVHEDFLIDTGASVSVVNDDFAKKLIENKLAVETQSSVNKQLLDANGNKLNLLGVISLEFTYRNSKFTSDFIRVKNLFRNIIIGLDFLIPNQCLLDFDKNFVEFKSKDVKVPMCITTKVGACENSQASILFVSEGQ